MINVLVWCDGSDEKKHADIALRYPGGIAGYTAAYLMEDQRLCVKTASFDDADNGLADEMLADTDVLVLYSHFYNKLLPEDRTRAVYRAVTERGMGLVPLHSALWLNAVQYLLGTCGYASYREIGEWEKVRVLKAEHPICKDLPPEFTIPHSEMYAENAGFDGYEEVLFESRYEGGEVSRSGLTWRKGKGRVFYFSPGHATYDVMLSEHFRRIVKQGVLWAGGKDEA